MTTAYITKYALTTGIIKVDGKLLNDGKMLFYVRGGEWNFTEYAHGNDFWLTEEEARGHVEVMRQKKIASLLKSMHRLENLEVKVVD